MKNKLFTTILAIGFINGVSADIIQQQNFDADIFKSIAEGAAVDGAESGDTYFNNIVAHASTGSLDMGFTHDGKVSTTEGGAAGVIAGKFNLVHYSSTYSGSDLYNADNGFFDNNPRNADLIFPSVALGEYINKTFSIDLAELGSIGDDDDLYIRLKIDGVDVCILDTRAGTSGNLNAAAAQNGATYNGTTLSYTFNDLSVSAQLLIDVLLDDVDDGYSFDNIRFQGLPIPIIASQDFDADIFKSIAEGAAVDGAESGDTYFNNIVAHASTGSLDMGFTHDGKVSTTEGGAAGVIAGKFNLVHYSSTYSGSDLYNADNGFFDNNPRNADLIFQSVDLTGNTFKTFSMDISEIGSLDSDDDLYIRLKINGTDVNIFDTRGDATGSLDAGDAKNGASLNGSTLTYNLSNIANSVQIIIEILTDDSSDGYAFDNIFFLGVSNPNAPAFNSASFARPDAFPLMVYAQSLSGAATDPNSDTLTYTKFNGPAWLNIASDGTLSGSPSFDNMGSNVFRVTVTDGNGGSDIATLTIEVKDSSLNPGAPNFSSDPILTPDGRATIAYTSTIGNLASDPTGDPLTIVKLSGPEWLSISSNGTLSGTPLVADQGFNKFKVYVTDNQHGVHLVSLFIQINEPDGTIFYSPSDTEHYRLIWDSDPTTKTTVAWKQISGNNGTVYYGTQDFGRFFTDYPNQKSVDSVGAYRGGEINSCFARLSGLQPDTAYYFVIKDDAGVSPRYWFLTAPASPKPFTFIAGGDSRSNHTPRRKANRMVSKLRPLFVSFTGDMISSDNASSWNTWFEHWQETISSDGRMYPLIPHRGNHESGGNNNFFALFDTTAENYYAFSVGGNLLRFYVLNSEMTEGGDQGTWLGDDLTTHATNHTHLAGGYHKPMRPHQSGKSAGDNEYNAWAQLFYDHGMNVIFEADSHTTKRTYPIKPFTGTGSDQGFIRDDADADSDNKNGTVYSGEGCWGAPLRAADDTKEWTMASGMFNCFDWVHVYPSYMELYTVKVDNEDFVGSLEEGDVFSLPAAIDIWAPASGARLVINDQNPITLISYSQWQLDQWGVGTTPSNTRATDDFDGDGLDNVTEFSFGLDPKVNESIGQNILPVMTVDGAEVTKLNYRRKINTSLSYEYEYSNDLITWISLTEGADNDYTQIVTPDGANEQVTIQLLGDKASAAKIFIRIHVGN